MRLKDKVCIVTGTASGIGKTIAGTFADEGAVVAACDRNAEGGKRVVEAIVASGGKASFFECDVSHAQQVDDMMNQVVSSYGRIDVLVNNAGVNFASSFEEITPEDWDRVLNTDLRGTFLCMRRAVKEMLKSGGGSIVNIGTVHTLACLPGAAPYDAAKWGVVGLSKSVAVEFADRNIRVNVLSPGLIATQIWDDILNAAPSHKECMQYWKANIPMGRVGTPEEIAAVAVFLASDDSSYMTGANVLADGGMTSLMISQAPYKSKSLEGR